MNELFDISGNDIAKLKDDDLRELVGRLCEEEYRAAGIGAVSITWGGHQDAADGGFDVVVSGNIPPPLNSFLPRNNTSFQVKIPAMSRKEILAEMKPNGVLRDSIKQLISQKGAYIIISAKASTTHSALTNRQNAIREAVAEISGNENLLTDFYDRDRIATWVRSHPTLMVWIREKIGDSLFGWQPYGNWSNSPQGIDDIYLIDDELRLFYDTNSGEKGENGTNALEYLRNILSQPKACVRLIGLSGVGKTRFVQALFDKRIGKNSISPTRAIYADIADSPSPDPMSVARRLIQEHAQAILVIDNCMPELHKRLKDVCTSNESTIGVLTIEYDVRDDLPEDTDVLRLEPASDQLICKIIERRYPHISQIDAQTISGFSGGNSRVAIALASTINKGETIGFLRDNDLFKRLFNQRTDNDENLLLCAEVLSLVYSFEGTDVDSSISELKVLSDIIERPVNQLFRSVAILRGRQLIQSRDVWRAILPHAIANRLAKDALHTIPKTRILDLLMTKGNERLLKSFSRRLSYLHDSEAAKEIATQWLSPTGFIGATYGNLNKYEIDILQNIAPVVPEKVLELFEYWLNGIEGEHFTEITNDNSKEYIRLLRKIAYEPDLFKRCVSVLWQFAIKEAPIEKQDSAKSVLKSLFSIFLSGTNAPLELRAQVIQSLLSNEQETELELALSLLNATFEVWHFFPEYDFNFGARPRNYGWQPRVTKDRISWYVTFIQIALDLAFSQPSKAKKIRELLANRFRGLWTGMLMYTELESMCDKLLQLGPWNEGWVAVRDVLKSDNDRHDIEAINRLARIEEKLRPANLEEMARTYAFSEDHYAIRMLEDMDEDEKPINGRTRSETITEEIGRAVAVDREIFSRLLPDFIKSTNPMTIHFGRGLADASSDKIQLWTEVRNAYESLQKEQFSVLGLYGILSSTSLDPFRDAIMDSLVTDSVLGKFYPYLQMSSPISSRDIRRLIEAMDLRISPTYLFTHIAFGRSHETVTDSDLVLYLKKLLERKEEGIESAIEILNMRLHHSNLEHSEEILEITREVLENYTFNGDYLRKIQSIDFLLANLADKSLVSQQAKNTAIKICNSLIKALIKNKISSFDFPLLIGKLALYQPIAFLDTFLAPKAFKNYRIKNIFSDGFDHTSNPLNDFDQNEILNWCEIDPIARYPAIAQAIGAFIRSTEYPFLEWNPLAFKLFERAPDLSQILSKINLNLLPGTYGGSIADIIFQRVEVYSTLFTHSNVIISTWAKEKYDLMLEYAKTTREQEIQDLRSRIVSFE